ncbi:LLM class flavin-dependent oxidoreductase [Amycolatopsis benzoatilytica]|uniref:LLM class flavin-dependent oxidoreductase n=1 Tax=Amycolatopsis benzoatilytica TaxID=346045 RepID=UPI003CCB8938
MFEGWTLLSAPAAQTRRLRLGRPLPAGPAKIAAGVDVLSGGRLELGIGAATHAVGSLAEACTVIRRLRTEAEPFDFPGGCHRLTGAFCNPKPVQRPHSLVVIGGRAEAVAEHVDRWNFPVATSRRRPRAAGRWTGRVLRSPDPSCCPSPATSPTTSGRQPASSSA